VQPLILEGAPLERYIGAGFDFLFHANAGSRPMLRFDRELAAQGPRRDGPAAIQQALPPTILAGPEHNGASAH
jgi:hypothetical protein